MSADETAATLKYSEYIVKVNDKFPVLKDKSLIKSSQLPKSLSKICNLFIEVTLRVTIVEFTPTCALYTKNINKLFLATCDVN